MAERLGTAYLRARARLLEGEVALGAGAFEAAREACEDAIDGFSGHAAPYDAALARLALGRALSALGRADAADAEVRAAVETLETLGAARDLRAAQREAGMPPAASGAPAAELTVRELEVLRLVARGHGDQQIAEELVLSPHTVHRHVANIRTKLRQPSRAAAVAYATRSGLL